MRNWFQPSPGAPPVGRVFSVVTVPTKFPSTRISRVSGAASSLYWKAKSSDAFPVRVSGCKLLTSPAWSNTVCWPDAFPRGVTAPAPVPASTSRVPTIPPSVAIAALGAP